MMVSRALVASLCRKYGAQLYGLPGIDGGRLMWALAGNESTFGMDPNPRHEPSYCAGGKYFSEALTASWGCFAHCSYGPWQLMFANVTPGISPLVLATDPEMCARMSMRFLQVWVLGTNRAKSLAEIGEVYNAGHITQDAGYVGKLTVNYDVAMPEVV